MDSEDRKEKEVERGKGLESTHKKLGRVKKEEIFTLCADKIKSIPTSESVQQ